ncbi:MAG: PEP/pyruvate-binding domain-containing protein, partial [Calditrichaceae bacterium]|nr:PEP/pyruvate-binding domain-containing protein [Calditrichaceae bacterium]
MNNKPKTFDKLIDSLEERVKELNCLYEIEEILNQPANNIEDVLAQIARVLPIGFQYTEICRAKIKYRDTEYESDNFEESLWSLSAEIIIQSKSAGAMIVYYLEQKPELEVGPFLAEEKKLLNTIAERIGHYIMYQKLKMVFNQWENTKLEFTEKQVGEWGVVLDLLRRTDPDLYFRISRKMLNLLVWKGIEESQELLQQFDPVSNTLDLEQISDSNIPLERHKFADSHTLSKKIFMVAAQYFSNEEILSRIQTWMQQDKTGFLIREIANNNSSLTDISAAIRKYYQIHPEGMELSPSTKIGARASLIRRFFSEQLEFINIAKNYVTVRNFHDILDHLIFPAGSHGKLGGKSAGIFLAYRILMKSAEKESILTNIKIPRTWYMTSDCLIHFMHYNNLDEMLEQKYKDIEEIQKEYPHVIQLFKNSHFPPDLIQGVSMALDDFGTKPLVVRSSSLLEDRLGSAFSGKYKSLFIANQGTKQERLDALLDAIAEVYASTIGPDPIGYRAERGLLDFHEEMGIMIQEVVGQQVGDYFFPSFAGVAFSNNEFRWSPRIKREDGLIRLVPGLGTRAVDRLADDYPVLVAPGQPGLRANVSLDEVGRYSPNKADVLNLKANRFETIDIIELFKTHGEQYPMIEQIVSIAEHSHLKKPMLFSTDYSLSDLLVTFDGLIQDTTFVKLIHTIMRELQSALATPVDIEFANDGNHFYLLQCRPQSYSKFDAPSPIPVNIPKDRILFTANRFVSNGYVPDIKYIVYISPEKYSQLSDLDEMKQVGKVVGALNQILPRREFILMGPGRWGSRGDIKLGVSVTYSDINNTAVLIEIARKKGNYIPDLSFGTHFFQDLVEASIRYLPLYPDESEIIFNENFLMESPNQLFELLPAYSYLSDVVRVIEIPQAANGNILKILMNAEQDKAIGIISIPGEGNLPEELIDINPQLYLEEHWLWRMKMAEKIALQVDAKKYGIKGMYIMGSTKNSTAQAGSDIDLIVLLNGTTKQKRELSIWLEGWSLCLDEINYIRTGIKTGGLLDVSYVNSNEIESEDDILKKVEI